MGDRIISKENLLITKLHASNLKLNVQQIDQTRPNPTQPDSTPLIEHKDLSRLNL